MPAWAAASVQVPRVPVSVIVKLETVQMPVVEELSETVSPDDAVGLTANADDEVSLDGIDPKVMVWVP